MISFLSHFSLPIPQAVLCFVHVELFYVDKKYVNDSIDFIFEMPQLFFLYFGSILCISDLIAPTCLRLSLEEQPFENC